MAKYRGVGSNLTTNNRLSSQLMMPDDMAVNNGSTMGGLAYVLQQAAKGLEQGRERRAQEEAEQVMANAGKAMIGNPMPVPDAPGPMPSPGDEGFTAGMTAPTAEAGYTAPAKPGNRSLAAQLMMSNPRTLQAGMEMAQDNQRIDADREKLKDERAWREKNAPLVKVMDPQNHGRGILIPQYEASYMEPFNDSVPQTVTTAEGVYERDPMSPTGLGRRLGRPAAALTMPQWQVAPNPGGANLPSVLRNNRNGDIKPLPGAPKAGSSVIGYDEEGNPIYGVPPKPMPASALKMQQEELDAIGAASSMRADMGAVKSLIEGGNLKVGPIENLLSRGKNAAGMSDENSRNFSTFQSSLEKLRNESLRLNKGVQTEGDSVRAWNELIANINDPEVVKQRISEIDALNERAANFRRLNVDTIRNNYGLEPLDTSGYERVDSAIGRPGANPREPKNQQPQPGPQIPPAAAQMLMESPSLAADFDAKYGPGASRLVLGR